MSVGPLALLKLLSSGVGALGRIGSHPPAKAEGAGDFAALLERAGKGDVASGIPVTIDSRAGVKLTDDQLSRLAVAADRAEAQGATRALVLIDGLALRLDVGAREVTGVADLKGNTPLTGIDAVISVPAAPSPELQPGIPGSPGAGPQPLPLPRADAASMNRSLLAALSGSGPR